MGKGMSEPWVFELARREAGNLVRTFDDVGHGRSLAELEALAAAWERRAREANAAEVHGVREKYRETYYAAYRRAVRDLIGGEWTICSR